MAEVSLRLTVLAHTIGALPACCCFNEDRRRYFKFEISTSILGVKTTTRVERCAEGSTERSTERSKEWSTERITKRSREEYREVHREEYREAYREEY